MVRVATNGRQLGFNRVRSCRLSVDMTQAELAAAVDVSRQTVNALEAGNYAPSVFLALRIAKLLSTTVETLFEEYERS